MNNVYIFTGVLALENPAHATKFFLTSSLVGVLARVYNEQDFSRKFSLTNVICSFVRFDKVSFAAIARMWRLGRYFMMLISINCQVFLVDHTDTNKFSLFKIWSAFQEDSLLRKNVCRAHERIRLVKKNLVVCMGFTLGRLFSSFVFGSFFYLFCRVSLPMFVPYIYL